MENKKNRILVLGILITLLLPLASAELPPIQKLKETALSPEAHCPGQDDDTSGAWQTYQHNIRRSGVTDLSGSAYAWELKASYAINDRILSPVVADLDGDGAVEAVFGSDADATVYCVELESGTLKWSFPTQSPVWSTPTLADLNDDGTLDVVFGAGSGDGNIYAVSHNGSELWRYFTGDATNSVDGHTAVADVDGDGTPEVLVGASCYYCSSCNNFFVLNAENGTLQWGVKVGTSYKATLTAPALGELDGDEGIELVIGDYDGYIRVYNAEDGSVVWSKKVGGSYDSIESTPALIDKDGDGIDDVAIAASGTLYVIDGSNPNNIFWSKVLTGYSIAGGISAGDIDDDGQDELVYYPAYSSFVEALDLDGDAEWYANVGKENLWASSAPAIADIDGDGDTEVVVQAQSGTLYTLNGGSGDVEHSFIAGSDNSISSVAIADVDGDGIADLVTGNDDGTLSVVGNPYAGGNHPPELEPFANITVNEMGTVYITPVASDPDGDNLAYEINSTWFNWDNDTERFKWKTGPTSSGHFDFLVTASDDEFEDSEDVHVTVNNKCTRFDKRNWCWVGCTCYIITVREAYAADVMV